MKHPVNFRLSEEALKALSRLAAVSGLSRTDIVERALKRMAVEDSMGHAGRASRNKAHPLAEFAGIWKDVDVEAMLADIRGSRRNKRRLRKR